MAAAAEDGEDRDTPAVVAPTVVAVAEGSDDIDTSAVVECASAVTAEEGSDKTVPAIVENTNAAVGSAAAAAKRNGETGERLSLATQKHIRFFLRGLARLQEHHLQDYFGQFAEVVEVNLVRDKKTKRPRGMAFLTLLPRATPDGEESKPGNTADALVEKLTGEDHKIDGVALEIQEALPNPKDDAEEAAASAELPEAGPAETMDISTEQSANVEAAVDPAALEHAQAQWKMHYLAMAINASVPDCGHLMPKQMPVRQGAGPASRHVVSAHPGAVPKATGAHPGAVPKAKVAPPAPWRRKGPYAR